ncbi:MAG TPA: preprotein translocase subunit SecG [Candidatus Acidoferrales bacterium]|nr:preprotein translocase subunit SecG [Candidatus Acidoferrales bacterium]
MPSWMKWLISLVIGLGILALGWFRLPVLLNVFFVLLCFVLIVVVLLQSGSAADLAGAFGGAGSQTGFNPRGAATILSKATTWCAIMFMLTAMALVLRQDRAEPQGSSILQKFSKPAPKTPPTPAPGAPAPAPATQTPVQQSPASQQQPAAQQPPQSQQQTPPSSPAPASKPAQTPPAKKP